MRDRLIHVFVPLAGFAALVGLGLFAPKLADVLNLALPFFGLILIGYICGKLWDIPETGLAWMNTFIVYVALPALFYNLISATPIGELANWRFILITTTCTALAYAFGMSVGWFGGGRSLEQATIRGIAAGYSNTGYMGPGLTLAAFGPASVVPTALIFVCDNTFFFTIVPLLMSLSAGSKTSKSETAWLIVRRVCTHPFNIATAIAFFSAATQIHPPAPVEKLLTFLQNAAAPCALFVMGVTVAQRPVNRISGEMPLLLISKLLLHPLLVWVALSLLGDFGRVWTFTAVMMAALPPALNVFVMASQYNIYVERASSLIMAGTIISVVTVTGLLYLIAVGGVPYNLFAR